MANPAEPYWLAGAQRCPPAMSHATEDGPMARYVVLLDWTDQGVRSAVKDTVQRVAQARTAWGPLGVRIETIYWTLGDHDLVAVIDAPDDATIAAALLQVAAAGNIRTKTLRAFDEGEMQTLLSKLG
jgi:uncharacterized protein with GYD domain